MKRPSGYAFLLIPLFLFPCAGCGGAVAPTACDGLSDKTLAISRAEYAGCAGQILAALEQVETPLRRFVEGDAAAGNDARSAHRRLKHMLDEVGFQADVYREVGGGTAKTLERWPDAGMREFNAEVVNAAVQFHAALVHPNQDNLQQGARLHANARSAYARFR